MLIHQFYVFQPTQALSEAMFRAGEKHLAPVSVWITKNHDRVGPENSRDEIETAFWTMFLVKLVADGPEPPLLTELRATCLKLGFAGCWSVISTTSGGAASELIEAATEAESFVQQYVINRTSYK